MLKKKEGFKIFNLSKKLWPYNRSLTGEGNRKTLKDLLLDQKIQLKFLIFLIIKNFI